LRPDSFVSVAFPPRFFVTDDDFFAEAAGGALSDAAFAAVFLVDAFFVDGLVAGAFFADSFFAGAFLVAALFADGFLADALVASGSVAADSVAASPCAAALFAAVLAVAAGFVLADLADLAAVADAFFVAVGFLVARERRDAAADSFASRVDASISTVVPAGRPAAMNSASALRSAAALRLFRVISYALRSSANATVSAALRPVRSSSKASVFGADMRIP